MESSFTEEYRSGVMSGVVEYCVMCKEEGHVMMEACITCKCCGLKGHLRKDCYHVKVRVGRVKQDNVELAKVSNLLNIDFI
jgi:hypothetical protein